MESLLINAQRVLSSFSMSNKIEAPVREHLTKVYGSLTLASFLAAAGAYIHLYYTAAFSGLSLLFGLGFLLAIKFTQHTSKNVNQRLAYLAAFGLCSGLGMGPLVEYAIMLNPSIVLTALTTTTFVFASFSLSCMYSKHGAYLALFGPLSTLVSTLFWLSLGNIFFGSRLIFQASLYLGLVAMCGFVLYDTTLIMERKRMGDGDFVSHSVDLFIDLIGMFKRILIILIQREEDSRRRRRRSE